MIHHVLMHLLGNVRRPHLPKSIRPLTDGYLVRAHIGDDVCRVKTRNLLGSAVKCPDVPADRLASHCSIYAYLTLAGSHEVLQEPLISRATAHDENINDRRITAICSPQPVWIPRICNYLAGS